MGPGFESLKVHQLVRSHIAEGPPVPIPNTEVKLSHAENTCLATDREDRSERTQAERDLRLTNLVRVNIAEGPPVPIPNTEVKLCYAEDTCLATDRENRSTRTLFLLSSVGRAPDC